MSKTEFLESLRNQLAGQMHEGKVAAHVQYYRDYIENQLKAGRSETEVLNELGDPRLIAKTLLSTDSGTDQRGACSEKDMYYERGQSSQSYENDNCQNQVKHRSYKLNLSSWYGKWIVLLLAALVIVGLIVLIGTILPVFIVVCVVLYLISRFRRS